MRFIGVPSKDSYTVRNTNGETRVFTTRLEETGHSPCGVRKANSPGTPEAPLVVSSVTGVSTTSISTGVLSCANGRITRDSANVPSSHSYSTQKASFDSGSRAYARKWKVPSRTPRCGRSRNVQSGASRIRPFFSWISPPTVRISRGENFRSSPALRKISSASGSASTRAVSRIQPGVRKERTCCASQLKSRAPLRSKLLTAQSTRLPCPAQRLTSCCPFQASVNTAFVPRVKQVTGRSLW